MNVQIIALIVVCLVLTVVNFIEAKPTAFGEFNSGQNLEDDPLLLVIPLPPRKQAASTTTTTTSTTTEQEDLLTTIYHQQTEKIPPSEQAPISTQSLIPTTTQEYPNQYTMKTKRALIFRPLFVYRQQQLKREKLSHQPTTERPARPACSYCHKPYYRPYNQM